MSVFTKFTAFERVEGTRKKYALTADLCWFVGKRDGLGPLVIPAGTVFDISVPRFLEWFVDPHDLRLLLAAAIHDEVLSQNYDVYFASGEFRRAAIARKYPKFMAWLLYVVTLGWTAFNRWRARKASE